MNARAYEGYLVGYTGQHMYRIYIPSKRSVDEYRQVRFVPNIPATTDVDIPSSPTDSQPSTSNSLSSSTRPLTPLPPQPEPIPPCPLPTHTPMESEQQSPTSSIEDTIIVRRPLLQPANQHESEPSEPEVGEHEPKRRSTRKTKATERYGFASSSQGQAHISMEPQSYIEAITSIDSDK